MVIAASPRAHLEYVKIAGKSKISMGKLEKFGIGDDEILVADVDGDYYAMKDGCAHRRILWNCE